MINVFQFQTFFASPVKLLQLQMYDFSRATAHCTVIQLLCNFFPNGTILLDKVEKIVFLFLHTRHHPRTWQACKMSKSHHKSLLTIATNVVTITHRKSASLQLMPCKSYPHSCSWQKNPQTQFVWLIFLQEFFYSVPLSIYSRMNI